MSLFFEPITLRSRADVQRYCARQMADYYVAKAQADANANAEAWRMLCQNAVTNMAQQAPDLMARVDQQALLRAMLAFGPQS